MVLSIKHPEADRLARELAEATGETLTDAVLHAIRDRLARETGRRKSLDLRAAIGRIQTQVARLPVLDSRTDDEILGYDPDGLPR